VEIDKLQETWIEIREKITIILIEEEEAIEEALIKIEM